MDELSCDKQPKGKGRGGQGGQFLQGCALVASLAKIARTMRSHMSGASMSFCVTVEAKGDGKGVVNSVTTCER